MKIFNNPAGQTINQYMNYLKEEYNYNKICFCGRLDPMARGEILVLVNEECKLMPKYLSTEKVYKFEIVFGIQTDSDDPLGIINKINFNKISDFELNNLKDLIFYHPKVFNQKFHNYSSKRINGKPLWYYKKNNINIELPTHQVEIYDIKIFKPIEYNFLNWKNNIITQIDSIDKTKDFNQDEIIQQWQYLEFEDIISLPIEMKVSSGFYIRQFVRDLSDKINYPLLTYDINRKKINFVL